MVLGKDRVIKVWLLRFDHGIAGKENEPCLRISFYLDGHMHFKTSKREPVI